ncbi:MAG: hypothetical protein IJ324_13180 [Lachnospiraceae bacterium]|nr:hypothetical protein [Lachnospiraceae bacterium]
MALCIFVLVIALNPPMSDEIANMLYGEGGMLVSEETPAPEEEPTQSPVEESEPLATDTPIMTPMPLFTAAPEATYDPAGRGAVYVITTTLNEEVVTPYVESGAYLVVPEAVAGLAGYTPIDVELVTQVTPEPTATPEITATPEPTATPTVSPSETSDPNATTAPTEAPTATPEVTATPVPSPTATPHPEASLIELEYEDLYFEPLFYPYYHMLDTREQVLYNQIYVHMVEKREYVEPYAELPSAVVKNVFEAVYNDHPELFYVDTAFSCTVDADSRVVAITLKYNELADDLTSAKKTFDLEAGKILSEAKKLDGNYEKEKYVHDKLTELVTYTEGADLSQSAYSALVNKETVCAGYARAFQYLMQQLGIPCYYCTGYSGVNHAWNIVYLYGDYYNVDVTWDDTDPATYDYFNRTDGDLTKTHQRKNLSVNLPACLGTTYRDLAVMEETEAEDDWWTQEEEDPLEKELALYYDTCFERIVGNGMGTKEYVDVYSADMWKKLCEVYENGQVSQAFFTRAFHTTGGSSMAMRVQGQVQENGTYKVTHTIVID